MSESPWKRPALGRRSAASSLLDWMAGLLVASAGSCALLLAADWVFRPKGDFPWGTHLLGSLVLFAAASGAIGALWGLVVLLELLLTRTWRARPKRRRFARALFHAALMTACAWGTAKWTFSGKRISATVFGTVGPVLFELAVLAITATFVWFVIGLERRCARGRLRIAAFTGVGLMVAAAGPIWIDMTRYVALYDRLHTVLELMAFALAFTGAQLVGFAATRLWPNLRGASRFLALGLLAVTGLFIASPSVRALVDEKLGHAWIDEVYVGRTLRRTQALEAALRRPDDQSLEMFRVERLVERYQLPTTDLHPTWVATSEATSSGPGSEKLIAARGSLRPNVLVYYVDTLRADAASDPAIMPHVAQFMSASLNFRRAYSPGSDTLRSLPALTGGNYFVRQTHANDLTAIARRSEHESVLVVPQSASEFLQKLLPTFSFERTITVSDYEDGKEVWGYGADRPTSGTMVDEALSFLMGRGTHDPFFLWLFNFDQHSWRELDGEYVDERAKALGVQDEAELNWRYRAVARSIDENFGRLLRGLEKTGLAKNTIVIFVSDHGEALGRGGFWVHSVFLWESLIRVPLAMRIPGVAPRTVDDIVSLVDVAPTVAPYMTGEIDNRGYHGVDLLGFAVDEPPERDHPLVLRAASRDRLARVGLIDPKRGLKLVVRLEAAWPELYRLDDETPDEQNVARLHPGIVKKMIEEVSTSPVFPRSADDFDMLTEMGFREF